jgi:hypothetical protein
MTYTTPEEIAQAKAAWDKAVSLLVHSGMSDEASRRLFGRILAKHKLNARTLLPALEAGEAVGTGDAKSWIVKAAQRAAERARRGEPALKCDWG